LIARYAGFTPSPQRITAHISAQNPLVRVFCAAVMSPRKITAQKSCLYLWIF
jgi:hypothetical protein